MQLSNSKKALISPLDWGLGHTTRCISIIRLLHDNNYTVFVACNNTQKSLLQQEFNTINFINLKGYNISYSKQKNFLPLKLISQLPKINISIYKENKWLNKTIEDYNINLVISDNRYGLFTTKVPCIFITHQLTIKAPFNWLERLLQKINYSYINKYSECWVPDFESANNNIAGILSHPNHMPHIPVYYINPLARFKKDTTIKRRYSFCFILSGPEPQRTIFESQLIKQIPLITDNCILVRGKPEVTQPLNLNIPNLKVVNHLSGNELSTVIQSSNYVITRSGYTSVMEIISLGIKSILIPTPGQTEQEYLAAQLMKNKWAYCTNQDKFNLKDALSNALNFDYQLPQIQADNLSEFIKSFLARIN